MKNPKIEITDNRGDYYWKKYFRSIINHNSVFDKIKDKNQKVGIKINRYD